MLLVVFGAGASYDSNPFDPPQPNLIAKDQNQYRPPLANQLFENRPNFLKAMSRYPKCQDIIPLFQYLHPDRSVESVLEQLQKESDEYSERHKQLAAVRYYLQNMLWICETEWFKSGEGILNYKALLDLISRCRKAYGQVCLVTFNYDRLLDIALSSFGINIQNFPDYIASEEYKLIKLHGSVNWAREVETPIGQLNQINDQREIANKVIEKAPVLDISQNYCFLDDLSIGKSKSTSTYPARASYALYPALAIPVETKLSFECPEEHLNALKACLPKVSKMLIIGWRATEQHFLKMLSENMPTNVPVMIVGENQKAENATYKNLAKVGIMGRFSASDGGFTKFITTRKGDEFLSA